MVRVMNLALLGATALLSTAAATDASVAVDALEKLPSFELPSFDYRHLREGETPSRVLRALEKDGILALKNVPNYTNLRERYLASAVDCALASENDESARHLSLKMFADGTKRLTLEAQAGRELGAAVEMNSIDSKCPGYRALHEEFSQALEHAVNTFGATLDETAFAVSDGEVPITSRKLVSDAVRLDHFHVYEPASVETVRRLSAKPQLSLPLHEDHGLFIAMAAPKFFTVSPGGQIAARRLVSDASGLVIRTADGKSVRPVLKDDEVVIMMGAGASRWLKTSHRIPAVMHGMRMPEELPSSSNGGERSLRAWFGKMTLLPAYQRVLESRQSFAEFANTTTRYLLQRNAGDLKTIGCATGRQLHESGGSCSFRKCVLKKDPTIVPPSTGCHQACNYGTEFFNAKCEKKCDCEPEPLDGVICWMLCVGRFPVSECPLENQVCSGLKNTCTLTTPQPSSTTPTPEPTTTTPTPEPTVVTLTPEPSTSTPTTTPSPTTVVPVTTVPPTTTPETPLPTTVTPISPTPTPAPSTAAPTPEPTLPVRGQC